MKTLRIVLILIFLASPLGAEQALVLTEIEQLQEKTWYLQRDLAAQTDALAMQKSRLDALIAQTEEKHLDLSGQLETLSQSVSSQITSTGQAAGQLQQLQEALFELHEKFNQKDGVILDISGKIGALEGSHQALRAELAAQQTRHDQTVKELREDLAEIRSQLETMRQAGKGVDDQLGLWIAGAILTGAILLTIAIALKGNRGRRRFAERAPPPKHEL